MRLMLLQELFAQVKALKRGSRVGRVSRELMASRIAREIARHEGYNDRIAKHPCRSANGAYLDGYYDSDGSLYCITWSDVNEIRQLSLKSA